jgi:hypothetical protein
VNSRIVHENIEPPEFVIDLGHAALGLFFASDITTDAGDAPRIFCRQSCSLRVDVRSVEIQQYDCRT